MQAEEVEMLISELAKVTGGERALVEECGGLLSKTHNTFQVCENHPWLFSHKCYKNICVLSDARKKVSFLIKFTPKRRRGGKKRKKLLTSWIIISDLSCIQVEECSLRGQLMQLHQRVAVADQSQKDTNNSSLNAVNMRWWFDFEPLKWGHQKFPARILLCRLYHTKWTQWPAWFICLSIIVRPLIKYYINTLQNLIGCNILYQMD